MINIVICLVMIVCMVALSVVRERHKREAKTGFILFEVSYTNFVLTYALLMTSNIKFMQGIVLITFPLVQIYNYLRRGKSGTWDLDTILSDYRTLYMTVIFILVDLLVFKNI